MGFLILKEEIKVAESELDCDATVAFIFSLNRSKNVRLEPKDIRIFMDCIKQKRKIPKDTSYIMTEILNDETGEVKAKNFRQDMIELVYKYQFAPKWLITAKVMV